MGIRKQGDIVAGICSFFIGSGVIVGAIRLGIGEATEPQPGFFPFLGGMALVILSGILFFQAWRGKSTGGEVFGNLRSPAVVVFGLVLYVAILESIGYVISTALLAATVLLTMKMRPVTLLILTSLILSVGSYVLFHRFLDVPLPVGIFAKIW